MSEPKTETRVYWQIISKKAGRLPEKFIYMDWEILPTDRLVKVTETITRVEEDVTELARGL